MATRKKVPVGTFCRHCHHAIGRTYLFSSTHPIWVHKATASVFCDGQHPGLTAKFAEPS